MIRVSRPVRLFASGSGRFPSSMSQGRLTILKGSPPPEFQTCSCPMSSSHAPRTRIRPSYEDAVFVLNGLQSNLAAKKDASQNPSQKDKVGRMAKYLRRLGYSPEDLNKLNAVHVAGTKGKGSSSAFIERILRDAGFKTGMYTSPHLVSVTERIKINGRPIPKQLFAERFMEVHDGLERMRDGCDDMPAYFTILTLLAFRIFLMEEVDVAVVEVGIGGEYDCTNVLPSPEVCVITTLDYDHVKILGHTLAEIAWQKAGILKSRVPCVVSPDVTAEALQVIQERAELIGSPLLIAPRFEDYIFPDVSVEHGLAGDFQRVNASVAAQAAELWKFRRQTRSQEHPSWDVVKALSTDLVESLRRCSLPGRAQSLKLGDVHFCVDGAHTGASMAACVSWFQSVVSEGCRTLGDAKRILVFNCTGDRDAKNLLEPLARLEWDAVLFSPILTYRDGNSADRTNLLLTKSEQIKKTERLENVWWSIISHPECARRDPPATPVVVTECINDAVEYAKTVASLAPKGVPVFTLVTGSMHLVGGVLAILDPDMNQD